MYGIDLRVTPQHPDYAVTRAGVVYSIRQRGKFKLTRIACWRRRTETKKQHRAVCLRDNSKHYVHRLVAETWIGPAAPGMQVDHLDVDPTNNRVSNLEYVTNDENRRRYLASDKARRRSNAKA